MRIRRINIESLFQTLILSGFEVFFYTLLQTGKIQLYVHPRLNPYIKFGMIAMLLISLFTMRNVFIPTRKKNIKPYFFFIIPLISAFAFPSISMDSTSMSYGGIKVSQSSTNTQSKTYTLLDSKIPSVLPADILHLEYQDF